MTAFVPMLFAPMLKVRDSFRNKPPPGPFCRNGIALNFASIFLGTITDMRDSTHQDSHGLVCGPKMP
jgi:hypothetical protein